MWVRGGRAEAGGGESEEGREAGLDGGSQKVRQGGRVAGRPFGADTERCDSFCLYVFLPDLGEIQRSITQI